MLRWCSSLSLCRSTSQRGRGTKGHVLGQRDLKSPARPQLVAALDLLPRVGGLACHLAANDQQLCLLLRSEACLLAPGTREVTSYKLFPPQCLYQHRFLLPLST